MQQTSPHGQHGDVNRAQWVKGWTPWGTPCSVLIVDGLASAARSSEKYDCPLGRLATSGQREGGAGQEMAQDERL